VAASEVRAVSPDVGLRIANEGRERYTVAGHRGRYEFLVCAHPGRTLDLTAFVDKPPLASFLGTKWRPPPTPSVMSCETFREAISAGLDGEPAGIDRHLVDAHLRRCASCRAFAAEAAELKDALRISRVDVPDLAPAIVAHAVDDWDRRWLTLPVRIGLVFVGAGQLALAVPGLLYGSDDGAPIHVAHEMGSWDVALAVAFLFAAWRPLRAVGMLPFVAVLSACLGLTAVVDLMHGSAVAVLETSHLLELVGAVLLWLLVHPISRPQPARARKITVA